MWSMENSSSFLSSVKSVRRAHVDLPRGWLVHQVIFWEGFSSRKTTISREGYVFTISLERWKTLGLNSTATWAIVFSQQRPAYWVKPGPSQEIHFARVYLPQARSLVPDIFLLNLHPKFLNRMRSKKNGSSLFRAFSLPLSLLNCKMTWTFQWNASKWRLLGLDRTFPLQTIIRVRTLVLDIYFIRFLGASLFTVSTEASKFLVCFFYVSFLIYK